MNNKLLILSLVITTLLFSACSSLGGLADEGSKSHAEFEQKIQNVSLNSSGNSTSIATALTDSLLALKNLQEELEYIEQEIDVINSNLNQTRNQDLDQETLDYLNELNTLTEKSKEFVSSLYDSTKIWDSYLSSQSYNPRELEDLNSTELIDSIEEPLDVWVDE